MFTLNCKGKLITTETPLIMGIINATPDSFYRDDLSKGLSGTADLAKKMVADGADILDIGGLSTKPRSIAVSEEAELERLLPVIEMIHHNFPEVIISADTYRSKVAMAAVKAGASMINDISGGNLDADMINVVAGLSVPYICMHMKGTPETMQHYTQYDDLVKEILDYFIAKVEQCKSAGIKDIIIDPGFGFAKNAEQNFILLKNLSVFKMLNRPLLAGLSRKSTVYKTLGTTAEEALNGTTVLNTLALNNGASILRVHDVKEAKETVLLLKRYASPV